MGRSSRYSSWIKVSAQAIKKIVLVWLRATEGKLAGHEQAETR